MVCELLLNHSALIMLVSGAGLGSFCYLIGYLKGVSVRRELAVDYWRNVIPAEQGRQVKD